MMDIGNGREIPVIIWMNVQFWYIIRKHLNLNKRFLLLQI